MNDRANLTVVLPGKKMGIYIPSHAIEGIVVRRKGLRSGMFHEVRKRP